MVESRSIWLSDHRLMNDKSEFLYPRNRLYNLLRDRQVYLGTLARYAVLMTVVGLTDGIGLFIGSLTRRGDDLGQWRSYAENGQGCVVAIDAGFLKHEAGVAIRTMIYDDQTIDVSLCAALETVQEQFEEAPEDTETLIDYARRLAADLFTMKHPCFGDEREVRISRMLVRGEGSEFVDVGGNRGEGVSTPTLDVMTREGPFGETSYIALPLVRDDGTSAITGVGLGPTISERAAGGASDHFTRRGLEVWRSALPYRV